MEPTLKYPDSITELLSIEPFDEKTLGSLSEGDQSAAQADYDSARRFYSEALADRPDCYEAIAGLEYIDFLTSDPTSTFPWELEDISDDIRQNRDKNRRVNSDEFATQKTALTSMPPMCIVELTTRCNFCCFHCQRRFENFEEKDITEDLLDRFTDQVIPYLQWVTITGFGEPTIGQHYKTLMARLVCNQIIPHFSTNTSTLTLPHIHQLIRVNANVILSVDGASCETFESIRIGGKWQRLIRALFLIKRIRNILCNSAKFRITFVAIRNNIHELPDMVRLIHHFGLDDLTVQDYHPVGDPETDKQSLRYDPDRANTILAETEQLAQTLEIPVLLPDRYDAATPVPHTSLIQKIKASQRILPESRRFPVKCGMI